MKYRKKPVEIEAVRWTGKNREGIANFCGNKAIFTARKQRADGVILNYDLMISTLEGMMYATIGDYIIKGVNGEYYPCKPDVFAKTYEEVEE